MFPTTEGVVDLFTYCHQNTALWRSDNCGVIGICPEFWTTRDFTTHSNCLTVNKYQQNFYQDGSQMTAAKMWLLFFQLLEFYIPGYEIENAVDLANDCLRLQGKDAVKNPDSYGYYLASESILVQRTDDLQRG